MHKAEVYTKRLIRIELTLVAWKATVLPLNYRRGGTDDEVLPLSYKQPFFRNPIFTTENTKRRRGGKVNANVQRRKERK